MKKLLLGIMFLAFLISCSKDVSNKNGTMKGKLVNELTGDPIVNATLTIDGKEIKTDSEGNFSLETETGSLAVKKISTVLDGYEEYSDEVIAKSGETVKIKLTPAYGETIEVDGLTVKLRKGIPSKALSLTGDDYFNMIKAEAPKLIQSVNGEDNLMINATAIENAVEKAQESYPNGETLGSDDETVRTKALDTLLDDFPTLGEKLNNETDETKIAEVYETVSKVYQAEQTYAVNRQLINNEENISATANNILNEFFDLTPNEQKIIISNIIYGKALVDANKVARATSVAWGASSVEEADNKPDALRHSLWQFLTCKYVTDWTRYYHFGNYKKGKGLEIAEKLGVGRETRISSYYDVVMGNGSIAKNYDFLDNSNRMDLHNNKIGRDYFNNNSSTSDAKIEWVRHKKKWFSYYLPVYRSPQFNVPSDSTAIAYLKNIITNGTFIDKANSTINTNYMNLGVTKDGISAYSGKIIYLVK